VKNEPKRKATPRKRLGVKKRPVPAGELSLMKFLARSAEDLTSTLKLEEVFFRIGERIQSLIDCQLFAVLLWNEETQLLEHSYSLCYGERLVQSGGLRLGQGIGGTCAVARRPVRIPDVSADPNYVRLRHPEVEIRSELAVPILLKGRLVGILDLESTELDAFTPQHETVLSALASHIAVALENAKLYEQLLRKESSLERDLETAKEIQKSLLPRVPKWEGLDIGAAYAPAKALGGDFFDFLPYGDGMLAVAVADVAGKATPAALYGSLAVGILRGYVVQNPCRPAEMLAHMNEALRRPRLDNRFVAMAYGVYDRNSRRLAIANAGFTRPFLVRGGEARPVPVEGVPLGLLPGIRYTEKTLDLRKGDLVAFCSDGVQECADAEGVPIRGDRLGELLVELASMPARDIAKAILRTSDLYLGERSDPPDDRTVVILKVTGD